MKLIYASALLLFVACNSADKNEKENAAMPGAYNMLSQSVKSEKSDTTYTSLQQLKIYTGDYMMYANFYPVDSTSSFGIGTYSVNKDTVTENVIYNANDTAKNESPGSFTLVIEKTAKGYKQIIPDVESQGQHIKLTEEYETTGTATTSPLDGAWKLVKQYDVKGKDTLPATGNLKQFKVYYAGSFMFGHTYSDSTNKNHTGMGYGKFAMSGANKSKELVTVSTYYEIRGQDVDIDIAMNGNDEYTQIITSKDGTTKSVEIYQRLKK